MKKIVGILVVTLLIATIITMPAFANKPTSDISSKDSFFDIFIEVESKPGLTLNKIGTGSISTPQLKIFAYQGFNHNITNITNKINEIYNIIPGKNNTQFTWNNSIITLPASIWNKAPLDILREIRSKPNCSKGINLIFANNDYMDFEFNGQTYAVSRDITCNGSRSDPAGGIIMRDTCNESEIAKVLAHELLHSFGLNHDQVKWRNPDTGQIESKKIRTTFNSATGWSDTLEPEILGFPVPPHGYGFYDRDADCFCNDSNNEIRPTDGDTLPGFDINGNCTFGDQDDRASLLYGVANRQTDTSISNAQREYIYQNAILTPTGEPSSLDSDTSSRKSSTSSQFSFDAEADTELAYIDIIGTGGVINYENVDNPYLKLSIELKDKLKIDETSMYEYWIDIDDEISTGDVDNAVLQGADYKAEFIKDPEFDYASLYEYVPTEGWQFISEIKWVLSIGLMHQYTEDDCWPYDGGHIVNFNVPLDYMNFISEGKMKIRAYCHLLTSEDYVDLGPEILLSKERKFLPTLNLDFYTGNIGDNIWLSGTFFSPNSEIIIRFDDTVIASANTDGSGEFTKQITIPNSNVGYHNIKAVDEKNKYHQRHFYVISSQNSPPIKPSTPSGPASGKPDTNYTYSSSTIDPDGDLISYLFDWGDGQTSLWTDPIVSGETASASHKWTSQGTYQIKVKARDIPSFEESEWGDPISVSMPRNRAINTPLFNFLQNFLEQYPILYQLFQLFQRVLQL